MSAEPLPVADRASGLARRRGLAGRERAILFAAGAVVFGLLSEHASEGWLQPAYIPILDVGIGWLMVACGLIAMDARPRQPAGGRLVLAGYLWFVGGFLLTPLHPVVGSLGFAFQGWYDLVLLLLALAFPARWPRDRPSRVVVVAVGALFAIQAVARLAWTLPPAVTGSEVDFAGNQAVLLADVARAAGLFAGGLVCAWRLVRVPPGHRRDVTPVLAAGTASAFAAVASAQYAATTLGLLPAIETETLVPVMWLINLIRLVVPLAVLLGVLRLRGARSAIATAVAEVGEGATTASLEQALATALGDPRVRVLPWAEDRGAWLDGAAPVDAAALEAMDDAGGRVAVRVSAEGTPVAALVVARSVTEDPALVEAGVALTRLVVRSGQQADRIRDQLGEVRASRLRIVEAADGERRRIERDLHDGLQQRMVALAIQLRSAAGGPDRDEALVRGSAELLALLEDVRELARGIHPAVLTEAGLGAAIRAAADRSPVPAEVALELDDAVPPAAQATAYYIVSEALANVAKHASSATAVWIRVEAGDGRLRLTVEDDGPGGANPRGHGLAGLADRVAALDGSFRVEARPEGGTVVRAELPIS